jgi:hypothetical protein
MPSLNNDEARILETFPVLERIPDKTNPYQINVCIQVQHNPDFVLGNPARLRGIWVEVKGRMTNILWYRTLAQLTEEHRKLYKVVLVSSSSKERAKIAKQLDKLGIDWNEKECKREWIEQALSLMTPEDYVYRGQFYDSLFPLGRATT